MAVEHERGIEIHRCRTCDGLWLDPGELDELVPAPTAATADVGALREEMKKVAPPVGEVRYRMCPRCGNPMNRLNYGSHSGVVIDECSRHGVYLDAREFEAIETFIKMGGLALKRQMLEERARRREQAARSAEADAAAAASRHRATAYHRRWLLADLFGLF
jgi:Zn-finger nucleic acid-binding protein